MSKLERNEALRLERLHVLGLLAFIGAACLVVASWSRRGKSDGDLHLRLNPNVAPTEVLVALPGLGPARVGAIEAARSIAPLRSLTDMDLRVRGIGPVIAADLKPYLRFDAVPTEPSHP